MQYSTQTINRETALVADTTVTADICIVGAGISGMASAMTAADLGYEVLLVDSLPVPGGQCVNSLIGLFCGVFGTAPNYNILTKTIFPELFDHLKSQNAMRERRTQTLSIQYDEVTVGRWFEHQLDSRPNIRLALSTNIVGANVAQGEINSISAVSKFGIFQIQAQQFIDASGDASLTWVAGFPCRVPESSIYGSQQFRVSGVDEVLAPTQEQVSERMREKGDLYGLVRREGIPFYFQDTGTAVLNMTHVPSSLDTLTASSEQLMGKKQADTVFAFLQAEFPGAFGKARISHYGFSGRRQTRWIQGEHTLTENEVLSGYRFDDAIARTAWPIELHNTQSGHRWQVFEEGHVHYVPWRSLLPKGSTNLAAVGRCIDGEPAALSSVRVMGPCLAMGVAAAHGADLAISRGTAMKDIPVRDLSARVEQNII